MARVTVEDCLENVENRFKLVMISTQRARQLARGSREAQLPGRTISLPLWHCVKLPQVW